MFLQNKEHGFLSEKNYYERAEILFWWETDIKSLYTDNQNSQFLLDLE